MKIAVVTGASSGLGREFVKQISSRYRTLDEIWVIARRAERLTKLQSELSGITVRAIAADLTNPLEFAQYKALLAEHNPSIRLLVNAAGFGKLGRFDEISEEDNTGMCELNCTALTKMTAVSLPYMCEGQANIINVASSAAFLPQPSFAVYAATKSYVLSLSTALNRELRHRGIAVTAVCPGPVNTEFFDVAETYQTSKLYKVMLRAKPRRVVSRALNDAYHGAHISVYGVLMKGFRLLCKLLPHNLLIKFFR